MGQILEAVMILCFGLAWPVSVYKSYTSASTRGKSLMFLVIALVAYTAGFLHVIIDYPGLSYLTLLYIANGLMISADIALFFRNRRLERNLTPCRN